MDNAQITKLCFGEFTSIMERNIAMNEAKKFFLFAIHFTFNSDKKLLSTISYNFIFYTFTEI